MSNSYYTFTPAFVPGEKVHAVRVNTQFTLIQQAFDNLPSSASSLPLGKATLGTESGTGNAYVVTMPNTRTANAAGDEVVFKATHQNGGASTLQVDAIPAVDLRRWNGDALSSGDILVGAYYVARYDATNGYFRVIAPAQVSTVSGAITYATPTGSVKLAASAGTATTLIRSDADIAIDQSIAPTWTGLHTFSNGLTANGAVTATAGTTTNTLNVGTADAMVVNGVAVNSQVQVNSDTRAIVESHSHSATAGNSAVVYGARSRGTTALPTVVSSGDSLFTLYAVGYDGADYALGGSIDFVVGTTPGSNDMPTDIVFSTSADGAQSPTERFRIKYDGTITSAAQFLSQAGSASAPTYSFSGDSNTGIYSSSGDVLGFAAAGSQAATLSSTVLAIAGALRAGDGAVATPAFTFNLDSASGMYRIGAGNIGFTASSTLVFDYSTGGVGIHSGQLFILDGLSSAPGLTFVNEGNTGIYRAGSGDMRITCNGSDVLIAGTTYVVARQPIYAPDGSTGTPSISFDSDKDTGLFLSGTNQISIVTGAVAGLTLSQTTLTIGSGVSTVQFAGVGTTASAANAFLNNGAGNQLLRSTSSIKYKTDVQDMDSSLRQRLMALRPITYKSLAEADDPAQTHFGLIAEEVAEVFPELVHRNAKGEPESVQYERIAVLLLHYLKGLQHG